MHFGGFLEQCFRAEADGSHHHEGHESGTGQQDNRLDDLYPGGGQHAAEHHVHHHQHAYQDHSGAVVQAEQQLDQFARAHHLCNQVQRYHHQRTGSGKGTYRGLLQAIGGHVGKGEFTQVTQALGDQEQNDRPAHQEAHGVDQAVVAFFEHHGRNTQERRGGHVVTRNGQAVLEAGNATTAGVEVGGGLGAARCPVGDVECSGNKQQEHDNGRPVGGLLLYVTFQRASCHGKSR